MEQSVLNKLCILYNHLYEQEKKAADYILKHPDEVIELTINELASRCQTSVATISRLCRKCEVDGFHHLKINLAKERVRQEAPISGSSTISQTNIEQSLQNILANKVDELKQTISLIDPDQLKAVLTKIQHARLVQLVAVGNTIPVAIDGAYRFSEIGIKAVSGTIWETQLAFSTSLNEQDVLIAISNSGESKQIVKILQDARLRNVTIIAITNNPASTIAALSDHHLQTVTREKLFLNEFCFSRVSAMTMIEILYLFLTVEQTTSYEKLSHCEQLIADEKL